MRSRFAALKGRESTSAYRSRLKSLRKRQAFRQDSRVGFGIIGACSKGCLPTWLRQVRQHFKGLCLFANEHVGITIHRERNRRVPGQRLSELGVDAATGQVADERVPEGVEVCHKARRVTIGQKARLLPTAAFLRL